MEKFGKNRFFQNIIARAALLSKLFLRRKLRCLITCLLLRFSCHVATFSECKLILSVVQRTCYFRSGESQVKLSPICLDHVNILHSQLTSLLLVESIDYQFKIPSWKTQILRNISAKYLRYYELGQLNEKELTIPLRV